MSLVVMLALTACAERNTAFDGGKNYELLAQVPVVGNPCEIEIGDTHAFVALDQGGVATINLDNHHLEWYTKIEAADGSDEILYRTRRISVSPAHDRLLINEIQKTDTIYILDSANPDSLIWLHSIIGNTQDIHDIAIYDLDTPTDNHVFDIAYCLSNRISLLAYNGAYEANVYPNYTNGGIEVPAIVSGLDIDASYLYAAAQQRGLLVIDKPSGTVISELAVKGEAEQVVIHNNYAYIAARQGGLQVVNLSDKTNPVHVAEYLTTGYASDIAYSNNTIAISSGGGGCYVFNISDPARPRLVKQITEGGYVNTVNMIDDTLIVGTRDNGIYFYKMN
jgi:hypothetical protein